jgi:hypothetical protein
MDMLTIKTIFMWCTIINVLLLVILFVICAYARDWVYGMHSRWFPISKEAFNVVIYSFLGLFKIFVLVFNLVPWIACAIAG